MVKLRILGILNRDAKRGLDKEGQRPDELLTHTDQAYKTLYYASRTGASPRKLDGTVAHPNRRNCSYGTALHCVKGAGGGA